MLLRHNDAVTQRKTLLGPRVEFGRRYPLGAQFLNVIESVFSGDGARANHR